MGKIDSHGGRRAYGGYTQSPSGRADLQEKADVWKAQDLEKQRLSDLNLMKGQLGPILHTELDARHQKEKDALNKRIEMMNSIPALQSELRARGITYPLPG